MRASDWLAREEEKDDLKLELELKPAIKGGQYPRCLCCSPTLGQLCKEKRIAVGFGCAALTKDGDYVWAETHDMELSDCMTVEQADEIAASDPDHDWRILLHSPLRGRVYQRHGEMQWMLIEEDKGFA